MDQSILDTIKKLLQIDPSYTAFDVDIVSNVNAVFATLNQLGVGPAEGFMITGKDETWAQYLAGDMNLNNVVTYIALRVRHVFDPPTTSYHLAAAKEQIQELEWRINTHREATQWVEPSSQLLP